MKIRTCLTILLVLLGLSTCPEQIFAESGTPISSEERLKISKDYLRTAIKLIKSGEIRQAIVELDASYRSAPSNEVLFLLARAYDKLPDQCHLALASWELLLRECKQDCPFLVKALARTKSAELECEGTLTLTSDPEGSEVFLDDQAIGHTPLVMKELVGGSKNLYLHKDGYAPYEAKLQLDRGWKEKTLHAQLDSARVTRGEFVGSRVRGELKTDPSPDTQTKPSTELTSTELTSQTRIKASAATPSSTETVSPPTQDSAASALHPSFPAGFDPYIRLSASSAINEGKIAMSAGASMIADLRCEYLSRFGHYIALPRCDHARLAQFDRYYIAVQPQQSLYLYLIMSNDQGQWQLLFPVPGDLNFIKAGDLVSIPNREWILFDDRQNLIDRISVIGSTTPIQELELLRGAVNTGPIPVELKRLLVPMAQDLQQDKSVQSLKSSVIRALKDIKTLHISFEVYR